MRLPRTFRLLPRMPGSTNPRASDSRVSPRCGCVSRRARPSTTRRPTTAARSCGSPGGRVCVQRVHDRLGRALVREVVEMGNLAALIEQECRSASARRAAVHGSRLHDEIVVGPVERVGDQRLHPRHDRIAFDVARDDAQISGNRSVHRVQPLNERAVGNLRGEPGRSFGSARLCATCAEELDEFRQRLACPASSSAHLSTERYASSRFDASSVPRDGTRDAYDAIDADFLLRRRCSRAPQSPSSCAS